MTESFKNFVVVEFEDSSVEVIPASWITPDQNRVFFPNKLPANFSKLKSTVNSSPGTNWELYPFKFIKSYDTYEKASRKAGRIVKSDLETSESEPSSKLRKRKDHDQIVTGGISTKDPITVGLPTLQLVNQRFPNNSNSSVREIQQENCNSPNVEAAEESETGTIGNQTIPIPQSILIVDDTTLAELKNEFQAFQVETVKSLVQLQSDITEIKRLLIRVLASDAAKPLPDCGGPVFPLKTLEELAFLESQLQSTDHFGNYVTALARVGGTSDTKIVNNICSYVFSHELALQIRLTACTGKHAIDNTKLLELICEAARKSGNPKLHTHTDVRKLIGIWCRGSCDRLGGRQKRQNHGNSSTVTETQDGTGSTEDSTTHQDSNTTSLNNEN